MSVEKERFFHACPSFGCYQDRNTFWSTGRGREALVLLTSRELAVDHESLKDKEQFHT